MKYELPGLKNYRTRMIKSSCSLWTLLFFVFSEFIKMSSFISERGFHYVAPTSVVDSSKININCNYTEYHHYYYPFSAHSAVPSMANTFLHSPVHTNTMVNVNYNNPSTIPGIQDQKYEIYELSTFPVFTRIHVPLQSQGFLQKWNVHVGTPSCFSNMCGWASRLGFVEHVINDLELMYMSFDFILIPFGRWTNEYTVRSMIKTADHLTLTFETEHFFKYIYHLSHYLDSGEHRKPILAIHINFATSPSKLSTFTVYLKYPSQIPSSQKFSEELMSQNNSFYRNRPEKSLD